MAGHRVDGAHGQLQGDEEDALARHGDAPVVCPVVHHEQLRRSGGRDEAGLGHEARPRSKIPAENPVGFYKKHGLKSKTP